ncbi:hypothetical protein SLS63_006141 [Diaporthe eres]|uniref:Ketoreductase domain-containing protein n=1 Tax=Diaporthe eres TaxID=83184 RepID=A0ABR1P9D1_DIAER
MNHPTSHWSGIRNNIAKMVMLRLTAEQYQKLPIVADESTCSGKTYVVTGGNSGLGLETARHLVEFNASRVILAVRNLTAGDAAKEKIEKTTGRKGVVEVRHIDMASQPSIQSFVDKLSAEVERIDGFVANAGVLLDSWSTVEGMEANVQVNVVNTLLLGTLVLPKLSSVARQLGIQPTLVFVVSVLGYTAKSEMDKSRNGNIFEGLNDQKRANMSSRYALSKLVEELAVRQLSAAAPVERTGVIVNMVAPGLCHSGLGRDAGSFTKAMLSAIKAMMARTAEEGSRTILHGLVAGAESHGKLLSGCKIKEFWVPSWGRSTLAQLQYLNHFDVAPLVADPTALTAQQIFVRTVISGEDNVRSLREFPPVDSSPPSPSDGIAIMAINYLILLSRQGKVRLAKWFQTMSPKEKAKIVKDVSQLVLARRTRMCNFLEYKDTKIVYRRYASLFFIAGASSDDNELITLEVIHRYVEQMDKYYGNVCELDIIFSFTKAYWILDELLLAGELQESSKKTVLRCIAQQDSLEDMEVEDEVTKIM